MVCSIIRDCQCLLESTGYSTLTSPPRLMWHAVVAQRCGHTHTQIHCVTPSDTIPSLLVKNTTDCHEAVAKWSASHTLKSWAS